MTYATNMSTAPNATIPCKARIALLESLILTTKPIKRQLAMPPGQSARMYRLGLGARPSVDV